MKPNYSMRDSEAEHVLMDDLIIEKEEEILMDMFGNHEARKAKWYMKVSIACFIMALGTMVAIFLLMPHNQIINESADPVASSVEAADEPIVLTSPKKVDAEELCGMCQNHPQIQDYTTCNTCPFDENEQQTLSCPTFAGNKLLVTDVRIDQFSDAEAIAAVYNFCSSNWDSTEHQCVFKMVDLLPELTGAAAPSTLDLFPGILPVMIDDSMPAASNPQMQPRALQEVQTEQQLSKEEQRRPFPHPGMDFGAGGKVMVDYVCVN